MGSSGITDFFLLLLFLFGGGGGRPSLGGGQDNSITMIFPPPITFIVHNQVKWGAWHYVKGGALVGRTMPISILKFQASHHETKDGLVVRKGATEI